METMVPVVAVCLAFYYMQLKHLLADYYMQNNYMLGKLSFDGYKWVIPLASHCLVHALLLFVVLMYIKLTTIFFKSPFLGFIELTSSKIFFLCLFDFVTHFAIDRGKVIASRGLTIKDVNFWKNLGTDQFLHHVVSIIIVYFIFI